MANLADIRAEVLRVVEDHITELTGAVTTHVQRAQRRIEDLCAFDIQHGSRLASIGYNNLGYWPVDAFFISVRDTLSYSPNLDLNSAQYGSNATRTFLREVSSFEPFGGRFADGKPMYWMIEGEFFRFWHRGDNEGPSLAAPGGYDISIPCFNRLPTLVNEVDTNWWSENLDDVLAYSAIAELFFEMRDPMAGVWSQRASNRFREFLRSYRKNLVRSDDFSIRPAQSLSGRTSWKGRRKIISTIP